MHMLYQMPTCYYMCLLFSVELSFLRLEPTGRVPFANDDHSDAISITENFVFGNSNQEEVYVCNSSLWFIILIFVYCI